MSLAFVYAGQGSQKVGMGADFYDEFPGVREVFDAVPHIREICFTDSQGLLSQTKYTQPCMVTFAVAITDLLKAHGIIPEMVAGLSLGEYSALYAAEVFDAKTVISLIEYRGTIMQESTQGIDCRMVAILGADISIVEQAIGQVEGIADIANINCTGQIVIGGETEAVNQAADIAKSLGAKKCIPLNVSGPFHTRMMQEAAELLKVRLDETKIGDMKIPVVFNISGGFLTDIKHALAMQIKSPVQFEKTIRTMQESGVDTVIEIGPGKVLSGFIKKTAPEIKVLSIETRSDFEWVKQQL